MKQSPSEGGRDAGPRQHEMLILDPNVTAPLPATEKDLVALSRWLREQEEARRKKASRAKRKRVRKQKTVLARKRRAAGR